jgi:PAS domain S-box-containing protein
MRSGRRDGPRASRGADLPPVEPRMTASLLEQLADGVIACDADGSTLTFNRRAREIFGSPAGHVAGEDCPAYFGVHPPGEQRLMPVEDMPLARALRGEAVRDVIVEVRPRHGGRRIVSVSGERVTDRRGRLLGAMVVCRDVTASPETALRVASAGLEHLPHAVIVTRADDGEILCANAAARRMLGFTGGELVGRPMWEHNVGSASEPRRRAAAILQAMEADAAWRGDVRHTRKDGTIVSRSVVVTRFLDAHHGELWVSTYADPPAPAA